MKMKMPYYTVTKHEQIPSPFFEPKKGDIVRWAVTLRPSYVYHPEVVLWIPEEEARTHFPLGKVVYITLESEEATV